MNLARVIGSMWATQKDPGLQGKRMMVLQPMRFDRKDRGRPIVALDTMDAGPGDTVIYATSSEAAIPFRPERVPTDATIVGIVERVDPMEEEERG